MGMSNDQHSPASLVRLLEWIQALKPNGIHIFAGSPSHWRTRDGDCDPDSNFSEVWRRVQNVSLACGRDVTGQVANDMLDITMVCGQVLRYRWGERLPPKNEGGYRLSEEGGCCIRHPP